MPRPRKPYWHQRDGAYKTRIEGREVVLRTEGGAKIARGDMGGAWAAVARLLAEREADTRRCADPSVEDICREYLIAAARECTTETMLGKEWILEKWCGFGRPRYGERLARIIGPGELHRMRLDWERQDYAGGMIRRLYREVRACWAWAARPEPERIPMVLLPVNPLAGMRLPPGSARTAKYVAFGVIRDLIGFAESRLKAPGCPRTRFETQTVLMLDLLAETGCRPNEACSATWADFDSEAGVIRLARHKTAGKTGQARLIVLPSRIGADLVALHGSGSAHPVFLFAHGRSGTGRPWTRPYLTAWFGALVREARASGIALPEGLTLYWLRHSYLTDAQMVISGERAANLAGNTKEIARGTYLHAQLADLRADADRVAQNRGG